MDVNAIIERPIPDWLVRARCLLETPRGAGALRAVAAEVGVHPVHLSRTFRRRFGITVRRYRNELRLARARRSLMTTGATLARIAAEVGFADHAHFTRTFKQATGMTPAEFRRRHRRPGLG